MSALALDGPCPLSELKPRSLAAPVPAAGEALVEVAAAAVNRSDLLNVQGTIPITSFPRIPGRDFAGMVVDGPEDLLGTACWGTGGGSLGFTHDGSHAQLLSVPVAALVPLPSTLTLEQAGAAGLSYFVSHLGLKKAGLKEGSGQWVLVSGAAGGVGAAASALAEWQGAKLIAAVLDDAERLAVLREHPDAVVALAGEEPLPEVVARVTGGEGADIVYDTVGGPIFGDCVASLAHGGRMVVITAAAGVEVPFDLFGFYRREATLLTANSTTIDSAGAGRLLHELVPGFESGALSPPVIAEALPLEDCADAYLAAQEGRRGRVILRPAE